MNIYILNTVGIGLDIIDLVSKHVKILGIIGLSKRAPTDAISDYVYQYEFCDEHDFDFIEMESYELKSEQDKLKLISLDIDVLIVAGWQRLVPSWLISHCSICVIGSHGSPLGITKGRGRSPQNWALLLGLESFYISIFEVDAGIDSGRIIDTRKFVYSEFDDIKTSYYKVSLLTADMIVRALQNPAFVEKQFDEQDHSYAEYFPQRTPQDGEIDWYRTNQEINDFVRALTKPYPGAESIIAGEKIRIWSLIPFDVDISGDYAVGEIVKIFNKDDILVRTRTSFVLIDDYQLVTGNIRIVEGMKFESSSFVKQMKTIIERHESKYSKLPIASIVKKYEC